MTTTLRCEANEFGTIDLDVLRRDSDGLMHLAERCVERVDGQIYDCPSGELLPLRKVEGSILGWGEFDQAGEHWELGENWVISPEQAAKLTA